MSKFVLLLIGLLFLTNPVLAYQVNIDAPDSLAVGKPLVVTGTTTFGVGTPIDVVLYFQLTTTREITRKIAYIQSDKTFKAVFDTTGLDPGTYKVEVPSPSNGESVTMQLVTLYDRTEEIELTSPINQSFTGKIYVAGKINGAENSGVQIEVIDPTGLVIFGPQYINTDNAAHFAADIVIPAPGTYEVSFTDVNGYLGSRTINALGQGGASFVTTTVATTTTAPKVISAHTSSSRDNPAYFVVETGTGPVTLYTTKSIDWVLEYVDETGTLHMQNDKGSSSAEKAEFQGRGKTVYVKVYPYKYAVSGDVFLYGENVKSVAVSKTIPAAFAATAPATPTEESPVMPVIGCIAVGIALLMFSKKSA
ncbi:hypothetical protein [Methanoregula sp.]|uniref:hypothetical protein n=1 Tax=Methanoregula sp. TaxID=2052170 RepID=UPI0023743A15|nr:hypothetical protein [Methanoregula sp.]MDD1685955.1 hypothetical protein [Methanoregula sp.]